MDRISPKPDFTGMDAMAEDRDMTDELRKGKIASSVLAARIDAGLQPIPPAKIQGQEVIIFEREKNGMQHFRGKRMAEAIIESFRKTGAAEIIIEIPCITALACGNLMTQGYYDLLTFCQEAFGRLLESALRKYHGIHATIDVTDSGNAVSPQSSFFSLPDFYIVKVKLLQPMPESN